MTSSFEQYSQELSKDIIVDQNRIEVRHEFLPLLEEARLEHAALFPASHENIDLIINLLKNFKYDISTIDSTVIVVSVGTSSTQWYNIDRAIGAYYIGADIIEEDPYQAEVLFNIIYQSLEQISINLKVMIICNCISYFVTKTIRLHHDTCYLDYINDNNTLPSSIRRTNIQAALSSIQKYSELHGVFTILTSAHEYKLNNKWLRIKAYEAFASYTHGVYLVDFGGGGIDLHYYDPNNQTLSSLDKDRFLRNRQDMFIHDMKSQDINLMDGYILHIKNFLVDKITNHAQIHDISPLCCYIYQTGRARQAYFSMQS